MAKVGRNEPCPCGSGKKYKRCCQNQSVARPDDFLWRRLRAADDQLTHKLLQYARRLHGYEGLESAWADFVDDDLEPFDPDSPDNQAFFPWYLFNWRPELESPEGEFSEGPTIAEAYLDRYPKRVSDQERQLAQLIGHQPFSFYEVLTCDPGQGYRLRDILLEQEIDVTEHAGSQVCQPSDIIYGRVIQVEHIGLLMGCGGTLIPPASKPSILQFRRWLREQEGHLTVAVLHEWEMEIRELYFQVEDHLYAPPELLNTEGDPLSLHDLYFEIDSPGDTFDKLKGLAAQVDDEDLLAEAEWDSDGHVHAVEFPWLQSGKANGPVPEHTVLGHLRIEGQRLIASVNSKNRAERIRVEIEARLGRQARYQATDIQSIPSLLREAESRPEEAEADDITSLNATPDVQQEVDRMLEAHWRGWIEMKLPALGGQTPMEAVQDADGREIVIALLDDMERREPSPGAGFDQRNDIERARGQLGLLD